MNLDIKLEAWRICDIPEKLKWLQETQSEILPISLLRAESVLNHPDTKDEQVILLVGFDGQQVKCFLGIIPEKVGSGTIGWLSTIWVHSDWQGHGVGAWMVNSMKRFYDHKIAATGYVPGLEKMYQEQCGLTSGKVLKGRRFYFYENLVELAKKRKVPFGFTLSGYPAWPKWKKTPIAGNPDKYAFNHANGLRDEWSFRWWLTESFVSPQDDFHGQALRYPFSRIADSFQKFELASFVTTVRDGIGTVSYVHQPQWEDVSALLFEVRQKHWKHLTVFHPELEKMIRSFISPFVIHKPFERPFLWTPECDSLINPSLIQPGDGDWGLAWG